MNCILKANRVLFPDLHTSSFLPEITLEALGLRRVRKMEKKIGKTEAVPFLSPGPVNADKAKQQLSCTQRPLSGQTRTMPTLSSACFCFLFSSADTRRRSSFSFCSLSLRCLSSNCLSYCTLAFCSFSSSCFSLLAETVQAHFHGGKAKQSFQR